MSRVLRRLWLLAVLATVLLSYASVQSVTMQAVMAAGHDMPGMVHAAPPAAPEPPGHQHHHMDGMDMAATDMSEHAAHRHAGHDMAGMAQAAPAPAQPAAPAKSSDPCAFCQAAAHAPLVSVALPLSMPSAVAYLPPLPAETPRAPGLWRDQPKARGPPAVPALQA